MLAGLLDHHKTELPRYKRIIKKTIQDTALGCASRAGKIKNEYVQAWKDEPEKMIVGTIAGVAVATAVYYRHMLKQYDKGFWVEICREWVDEMDAGKFLVMKIDGDSLFASTMNQDGSP